VQVQILAPKRGTVGRIDRWLSLMTESGLQVCLGKIYPQLDSWGYLVYDDKNLLAALAEPFYSLRS